MGSATTSPPLSHGSPESPDLPRLSPSQKAYQDDPVGFVDRLLERANNLFDSGYLVYPTDTPHLFLVTCEDKKGNVREYAVHALDGTCACAFYTRQAGGEYLTDDQTILACKHWQGLPLLVRRTRRWLFETEQLCSYCALWVHWMKTRAHIRRERIEIERKQRNDDGKYDGAGDNRGYDSDYAA